MVLCRDKDKGRRVPLGKVRGSGSGEGSGHTGGLGMVSSGWMEALGLDDILGWGE